MTSIEYGGGPTLQQRKHFANLHDGTQVPGYRGYCPQLKYHCGHTFGSHTHHLAKTYEYRHSIIPPIDREPAHGKPPTCHEIPDSNGHNKFTKNMVPGFTGYVPRSPFMFGETYKNGCDRCIDDHLTSVLKRQHHGCVLRRATRAQPPLLPLNFDPDIKDHLRTFRDTHPEIPIMMNSERGFCEPTIPRYAGFMPRVYTTTAGLGVRHHEASRRGLAAFRFETTHHANLLCKPVDVECCPSSVPRNDTPLSIRVFQKDGMIPKYIGHVHERRFTCGKTYGDTTRALEVCYHDNKCFGERMRTKPRNTMHIIT